MESNQQITTFINIKDGEKVGNQDFILSSLF